MSDNYSFTKAKIRQARIEKIKTGFVGIAWIVVFAWLGFYFGGSQTAFACGTIGAGIAVVRGDIKLF